jgi:hypothetical protein
MTHAINQLSVTEFIAEQGFEIDQLYVDKFWDNISDDKWIYVGNEMLEWIGYSAGGGICGNSRNDMFNF